MTYNPSYIADLLIKSHLGNLNEEEQQLLDHWLAADPRHPQLADMLLDKERLKKQFEEYRAIDSRGSWESIRAQLPDLQLPEYGDGWWPSIRKLSFFRNQAALWLTLVALGVSIAGLIWWGSKGEKTEAKGAFDLKSCKTGCIVTTPKGANYRLRLPDSSTVILNAESRIEVDSSYGKDRRVTLQGEAYFEVKHRDGQVFNVEVGPLVTIIAMGTEFDVKAYPRDSSIRTSLISGKLRIRDIAGKQDTLEAHQTLVMDRFGQIKAPPVPDSTDGVPWVQGQFTYNGTPIWEILDDLSHWYKEDIEVQGEPKGHFTFSCSRRETLQFILERLARTKHLSYKTFENKVVVYFNQP
jgi:ferric-dicitrate binding protein FerR (iron transport regulator)